MAPVKGAMSLTIRAHPTQAGVRPASTGASQAGCKKRRCSKNTKQTGHKPSSVVLPATISTPCHPLTEEVSSTAEVTRLYRKAGIQMYALNALNALNALKHLHKAGLVDLIGLERSLCIHGLASDGATATLASIFKEAFDIPRTYKDSYPDTDNMIITTLYWLAVMIVRGLRAGKIQDIIIHVLNAKLLGKGRFQECTDEQWDGLFAEIETLQRDESVGECTCQNMEQEPDAPGSEEWILPVGLGPIRYGMNMMDEAMGKYEMLELVLLLRGVPPGDLLSERP